MKFNLISTRDGISEYESKDGSMLLKFFKYAQSIVLEKKEDNEIFSLLYEELDVIIRLKNKNK